MHCEICRKCDKGQGNKGHRTIKAKMVKNDKGKQLGQGRSRSEFQLRMAIRDSLGSGTGEG